MAARTVAATATIEQLRTTFNALSENDFGDIANLSATITASNLVDAMNELESEVQPLNSTFITAATDLGGAPDTADSMIIRDDSANDIREMTIANLFTSPAIDTITASTFTLDASGDINLDADGGDIFLKDGGTTFGSLTATGSDLIIKSGTTTAMTMSGADVTIAGNLTVQGTTTTVDSATITVTSTFTFEGATADSFETNLTVVDPTADRTVTIPDATGTISLLDNTETLSNKTLVSPIFTGNTETSGSVIFEGSTDDSFETTLTVVDPTADRIVSLPDATDTLVGRDTTDTLTNKTLTSPNIATIVNSGTLTLPTSTDTLVGRDTTDTLTNKTLTTPVIAEIDNTGDITLDASADINLDAGGADIKLKDDGTHFASLSNSSSDLLITTIVSDRDIKFTGNDGGGGITALTLDMSDNGKALFNAGGTFNDILEMKRGATSGGKVKFFEDSDNGTNSITIVGPSSVAADVDVTLPTQAGTIVVSNSTADNDVQLDSFGVGTAASGTSGEIRATNDITAFYSSDIALKENITEIPSALDMVDKIRGVFFDWKDDYIVSKGGADGYFVRKHDVGLIAQEVEAVMPEIVGTRSDGIKAIKYDRLVPLLLQAIKELKAKIK